MLDGVATRHGDPNRGPATFSYEVTDRLVKLLAVRDCRLFLFRIASAVLDDGFPEMT